MSDLDQCPADAAAPPCPVSRLTDPTPQDPTRPNATQCDISTKSEIPPTHLNTTPHRPAQPHPANARTPTAHWTS
jgi:hypothetical protein